MMTDPIADMLTRIRNAVRIERTVLDMPASPMRRGIAQVLKDEGYIWDFEEIETIPAKTLRLHMKYGPKGERLITQIDRVSKPGRRIYKGYRELKPILGGMGIQILSTPRGVISDRRCRAEKLGGEVIAIIESGVASRNTVRTKRSSPVSMTHKPSESKRPSPRRFVLDTQVLRLRHAQLAETFDKLDAWTVANPTANYIDASRMVVEDPGLDPWLLTAALAVLSDKGQIRAGLAVVPPGDRWPTDAVFDYPTAIPSRMQDSNGGEFDSERGELVPVFRGRDDD